MTCVIRLEVARFQFLWNCNSGSFIILIPCWGIGCRTGWNNVVFHLLCNILCPHTYSKRINSFQGILVHNSCFWGIEPPLILRGLYDLKDEPVPPELVHVLPEDVARPQRRDEVVELVLLAAAIAVAAVRRAS